MMGVFLLILSLSSDFVKMNQWNRQKNNNQIGDRALPRRRFGNKSKGSSASPDTHLKRKNRRI